VNETLDVVIVGAGLSGATAAVVLGRQGRRVAIVDPQPECKPVFKAEKIEADHADLLRRLSVFDGILPYVMRVQAVDEGHWGRTLRTVHPEQYGTPYQDIVNAVRRQTPPTVQTHVARVDAVETTGDLQSVRLSNDTQLVTRLVVLATGTGGQLHKVLGIDRRLVREAHSLCSGFDVERIDAAPFEFDSLTYWPESPVHRIDYATFFPISRGTRVNLFSYRDPTDPWVHALAADPAKTLHEAMPGLRRLTGPWRAASKVETRVMDLYQVSAPTRDGIVLVGDAFQSVCPATGTGLSKLLTDVERLCLVHLPAWLSSPGMAADKIAAFYADPEKMASDRYSLDTAEYRRQFGTNRSLRWWIYRTKGFAKMALNGLRESRRTHDS
jgi:2-polyprenyl-6-methoxyphenol hydroxylase-like FAD-dependent oxidoreductase